MKGFVCHKCLRPVRDIHDQIEVRTEYRRISDYGRYAVVKTAELCRACTDLAVAQQRGATTTDQPSLI